MNDNTYTQLNDFIYSIIINQGFEYAMNNFIMLREQYYYQKA